MSISPSDALVTQEYPVARTVGASDVAHPLSARSPLPPQRPSGADREAHGGREARERSALPSELVDALSGFAQARGVTLFASLLGAFEALLWRYGGGEDLLIGASFPGRRAAAAGEGAGAFGETLALRARVSAEDSFEVLSSRAEDDVRTALAHGGARRPLYRVTIAMQEELSESARVHRVVPLGAMEDVPRSVPPLDFSLHLQPREGALVLEAVYDTALYEPAFVRASLAHFRNLLSGAVASPGRAVAALPLLSANEWRRIVCEWNRTGQPCDVDRSVARRVLAQAERAPEATAVRAGGFSWSYSAVVDKAIELAGQMRARGLVRGAHVPLLFEHGPELVFAELAALFCGAVFVPLDPRWPQTRLDPLLEELEAPFALIAEDPSSGARPVCLPIPALAVSRAVATRASAEARAAVLEETPHADAAVYVIYTSGTSGSPKGALNRQLGLLNRLDDMTRRFGIGPDDVVLQSSAPHFDPSIWQILWPLTSGASVLVPEPGGMNDLHAALRLIAEERVSVTHFVPSWLTALLAEVGTDPSRAHEYRHLREVLIGGEAISPRHVEELMEWLPGLGVSNVYGPSETAMGVLFEHVARPVEAVLPIGRPIGNVKAMIVDAALNPVPVGVEGELLIGGHCVGLGYLHRPELSARAFIANPWPEVDTERWYRTGDRARYRADGRIDFLGRRDEQVQMRGMRVELGDIERSLTALPGVADALVVPMRPPRGREDVLVAYVVPDREARQTIGSLAEAARSRLPTHMCPAHYVVIERRPRLSNGKTDRRALPPPAWHEERPRAAGATGRAASADDSAATEAMLLALWQELVPHVRAEATRSYFDQGGHSLLIAQYVARIAARTGVRLSLRELFGEPTPRGTARLLDAARRGGGSSGTTPEAASGAGTAPTAVPAGAEVVSADGQALLDELERREIRLSVAGEKLLFEAPPGRLDAELRARLKAHKPRLLSFFGGGPTAGEARADAEPPAADGSLSSAQYRLWFLDRLGLPPALYAIPVAVRLRGTLRVDALESALIGIVERHEALRTVIRTDEDGEPRQRLLAVPDTILEHVTVAAGAHEEAWQAAAQAFMARPFDLAEQPMLRALLLRLGGGEKGEAVLLIVMHHIASDGWSVGILQNELGAGYARALGLPADSPPPLPLQYAAFATRQRRRLDGGALSGQLDYWRERLGEERPETTLPLLRVRPPQPSYRGAHVERLMPRSLTERLERLGRDHQASLFMTALAAFYALLYRLGGQREMTLGTPAAGRGDVDTEGMIGFFVNTLALRVEIDPLGSFAQLLEQVRRRSLEALDNQDVPFERLVQELRPDRQLGGNPLFQIMFVLQNTPRRALTLPGVGVAPVHGIGTPLSKFDLTVQLHAREDGLHCRLTYAEELFERERIEAVADHYRVLLEALVDGVQGPIARLPLFSDAAAARRRALAFGARRALDECWNLYGAFAERAKAAPSAIAFRSAGRAIDYAAVERLAVAVHRRLDAVGVARGDIVGVSIGPGASLVGAVLGVLRAGGVWLPLDPSYPLPRLQLMLDDARASLVLARRDGPLGSALPAERLCPFEDLPGLDDGADPAPEGEADADVPSPVDVAADDAAFLIYTSGSTGVPKGVRGTHRGLQNRLRWMWREFPFEAGERGCLKTPVSFVDSIWETFGPLCAGVPSEILSATERSDPARLLEALERGAVTRLVAVPSLLALLIEEARRSERSLGTLRYCFSSGETLPVDLARRFARRFPHVQLVNLYGSSEVTADVTWHAFDRERDYARIPIGRPIDNTSVQVLDELGMPAPIGARGEIVVGGANVALGYRGEPLERSARFAPDPDGAGRRFRSGDFGRWNAHGEIELLGREDHQRKVRGQRIDCLEVQETLVRHPAIVAARVDVLDDGSGGMLRAVVQREPGAVLAPGDVVAHAAGFLPRHAVPDRVHVLERLPLLPNGKLDTAALGSGDIEALAAAPAERAPTALETRILTLWRELLGMPVESIDESFFALGGHSLLAVRLVHRLEALLGRKVPIVLVFERDTVRGMAEALEGPSAQTGFRSLMSLSRGEGGPQLFLVPPIGMTGLYFAELVHCLPDSVGVCSFDSAVALEHVSAESLAAHYLAELRRVAPTGPWHVGAACFGNHFAFELARQLSELRAGRVHLYLIDSNPPLNGPGWGADERLQRRSAGRRHEAPLRFYAALAREVWHERRLRQLARKQLQRLRGFLDPTIRHYLQIKAHQLGLLREYVAEPFEVDMVLMMSRESAAAPHAIERWQRLCRGRFELCRLSVDTHAELARRHSAHWGAVAEPLDAGLTRGADAHDETSR